MYNFVIAAKRYKLMSGESNYEGSAELIESKEMSGKKYYAERKAEKDLKCI